MTLSISYVRWDDDIVDILCSLGWWHCGYIMFVGMMTLSIYYVRFS